jgi:N-acetylglucosamine kinase-like BadF-type ATPase
MQELDEMKYYLGVDGGGSKTYTLITDQHGTILGKGHSGNGNYQIDYEQAKRNISESINMALLQAGLKHSEIEFANFGLAGADREIDYKSLRPMIQQFGFPRSEIVCDTMIALRAGTSLPYGVVLICGSGTNSAGKNHQGEFYQCGGYSYKLGDFGGGGALAIEAFRSVIRAWDGRERPTALTELLLAYLGYSNVGEMFDDYINQDRTIPLDTVKLLFQAAGQGDAVACEILQRQGEELGKSACAVIKRLKMEQESFDVVLAGSVLTKGSGAYIYDYIESAVKQLAPNASLVKLDVEPVIGSVWMAMEAAGNVLSTEVSDHMRMMTDYQLI